MHDEIGLHGHDATDRELPVEIEQFAPGMPVRGIAIERGAKQRREDDRTQSDDDGKPDENRHEDDCTDHVQRPLRRDFAAVDFFATRFAADFVFAGAVRFTADVVRSGLYAHASISTAPPAGKADTWTVLRAGRDVPKPATYASLNVANVSRSVRKHSVFFTSEMLAPTLAS